LTYKPYGKQAILIEWPKKIDENILKNIINFKNEIFFKLDKSLLEVINTYNSLTIVYTCTIENIYDEILALKSLYELSSSSNIVKNFLWKIPVCYDVKFGIDLEEIGMRNLLEIDAIIERHSAVKYTVYFIGFLPGFLYLGGLDESLHSPRKATPRLSVEKGSVAIGGSQTGIYPQKSAGGWNIIGKTPISLFDISKDRPCFARSGDKVQFVPVTLDEYMQIETQVAVGFYELEKSPL